MSYIYNIYVYIFFSFLLNISQSHKATGQARKQLVSKKVPPGKQVAEKSKEEKQNMLARDINVSGKVL